MVLRKFSVLTVSFLQNYIYNFFFLFCGVVIGNGSSAFGVVVVDDGSKDETSRVLIEAYNMHPVKRPLHRSIACQPEEFIYESHEQKVPLTLIRKKNGGKTDALNMGINAAQ